MAWFGDSIGNIKNQISTFTREVLNEAPEENKGSSDDKELEVSRELITDLEKLCLEQKEEIDRLKVEIRQCHEKPEVSNLQVEDKSEYYQRIIDNKEEEILRLKNQIAASIEPKQLLEHEAAIEGEKSAIISQEAQVSITRHVGIEAIASTLDAQTATDDSDFELQESYSKELEERCNSYQNDLYVLRGELMALQLEYDHHVESTEKLNEEILDRMHSDFIIDGQPSLRIHKKQSDESGKVLRSAFGQLSNLWRDLVEKKGTLERTVAKLSAGNRQELDNEVDLSPESTPTKAIHPPQHQQQQQQLTDFLPAKIDSFGLETILEEERSEEESFTDSFQHGEQAARISIHKSTVETLPPINSVTSWTQTNDDINEDEEQKLPRNYLDNLLEQEKEWMAKVSERDGKIQKLESDLGRLKTHLVELEEQYTSEVVVSEEKEQGLKFQMAELQKEIAQTVQQNEQNGSIREEVIRLNGEKELLKAENISLEDQITKMNTQLQNLHFVLETFQKEKATEIKGLEKSFRAEKAELEGERDRIGKDLVLESSLLAKARAGLDAAQELSTQIEEKSRIIGDLKVQVAEREAEVGKLKSQMEEVAKNLDGKIDRYLIKNLIVGYFSTPGDKRKEVLRVIATVLDFNREDRQKTGLESSSSLWPFGKASSLGEKQSLSEAFIRFLESESQPILQMKMGSEEIGRRSSRSSSSSSMAHESSASGVPTEPPHPVSEMSMALPILNQADKSNSILKDVLNPKL